jgi:hypothetical protein
MPPGAKSVPPAKPSILANGAVPPAGARCEQVHHQCVDRGFFQRLDQRAHHLVEFLALGDGVAPAATSRPMSCASGELSAFYGQPGSGKSVADTARSGRRD